MKQAPAYWTDETTAMALKLRSTGLSCSEIAASLPLKDGLGPSRSAVLGKFHRIGAPAPVIAERTQVGDTPVMRQNRAALDKPVQHVPSSSGVNAVLRMERQLPPDTPAMAWDDVGNGCQWPVGKLGAEDRWCGATRIPSEQGKRRPYCGEHWAQAFDKRGEGVR